MKIVLTAHQFLPDFKYGTEILTFETAKELKKRGHDVEIWTTFPADRAVAEKTPFDSYEYDGLRVHRHNQNFHITGTNPMELEYNSRAFAERFSKYLKEKKTDIVHFFHLMRLSASAIDATSENGIPALYTTTDFWPVCPMCQLRLPGGELCLGPDPNSVNCLRHLVQMTRSSLASTIVSGLPTWFIKLVIECVSKKWWPEKKISQQILALSRRWAFVNKRMHKLDKILVPTRLMENILVRNGIDSKMTEYNPFGLNLTHYSESVEKKASDNLRIGYIGTLFEHKGVHVLLEAVNMLKEDLPMEVKIYGDLEEFPDYVNKLKKLVVNNKKVQFLGTFPNDRIGEIFSEIDILVVPSIWYENTPLVIYSALASRTPVVATNLGGMSEVVHHRKNGLLFEKGDSYGLSMLLKQFFNERSLLEKLAENIVPPTSIPEYVDTLEKLYAEVIMKRN